MRCSRRIGFHGSSRIDDEAAVVVKIESLRRCVGRQQQPERIARERREHRRPLIPRQAAMQHKGGTLERLAHVLKGVPTR